jgi:hypothetical protein
VRVRERARCSDGSVAITAEVPLELRYRLRYLVPDAFLVFVGEEGVIDSGAEPEALLAVGPQTAPSEYGDSWQQNSKG